MILTNSAPSTDGMHFRIYDKASGVLKYAEKTSSGSYGGCVGLKDGRALVNTGQSGGRSYGTHIFFPNGNGWSKSTNEQNYAPNDQPNGSQIAVGADGRAYILVIIWVPGFRPMRRKHWFIAMIPRRRPQVMFLLLNGTLLSKGKINKPVMAWWLMEMGLCM